MRGNRVRPRQISASAVVFALSCLCFTCLCFEIAAAAETKPSLEVQSYEQLQEQQQSILRALEQARQDAAASARSIELIREETAATAKRNSEAVEARLGRIEESVNAQHQRELENLQRSHRFTLIIVGVFAGVGFFGMLFFAVFLLRVMNQRTETLVSQIAGQPFGPALAPAALGAGDTQIVPVNRVEQSTTRFLNTIERLEKRILELEGAAEPAPGPGSRRAFAVVQPEPKKPAEPPRAATEASAESSDPQASAEPESAAVRAKAERAERDARVALLLGKGQALLNLQQADNALACFDEIIALDSTNAEAFVKKGIALERLGRLDDAINSYDRAIALDDSMTMAYLSKGGVFNRLERYGEALQCYEQALRAQQKPGVT
jgi:tetratricopeptide (TPR) repeat protein